MESSSHQKIAERAYALWEQEGRPQGRDLDHWQRAEQEVAMPDRNEPSPAPAVAPRAGDASLRAVRSPRKPTLATRRGRRVSPDSN